MTPVFRKRRYLGNEDNWDTRLPHCRCDAVWPRRVGAEGPQGGRYDRAGAAAQRALADRVHQRPANVIPVKGKFQARLQVAGDGRGGVKKRKQHSLPGLFSTALEAAQFLALFKKEYEERGHSGSDAPPQAEQAAQAAHKAAAAAACSRACS